MITDYHFGSISVNGRIYNSDLIIYPEKVDASWWRKEGHALYNDDLKEVWPHSPDALVIGTGAHGVLKVSAEVISKASGMGTELIVEKTNVACERYNEFLAAGKKVIAALHLTC